MDMLLVEMGFEEKQYNLVLGIGCNFMIDNQLHPTDRLSIIIESLHFFTYWVLEV